ncbi:metal-dependent transcriptional regulator [Archaeoglobales archaeon]|nr:MAG: metal-dependent transcriptional regulator [Archaeoglobales archaeon]
MERVEEYLEAIYDIQEIEKRVAKTSDLAKKLNIKPSSVTEMLTKLSDKGYIEYQPYYGATLTPKGEEVAKRIKKYYRIFIKFFRDFLGIEEEEAKKLSCELEHHVSDEIVEKICELISTECNICEECNYETKKLSEVKSGKCKVIIAPKGAEDLGIKPGKILEVRENCVEVDEERFEVSEKLKSKILVERVE